MKSRPGIQNPYYLIEKYLAGNASPNEVQDLFNWKNNSYENERLFEQCYAVYERTGQFDIYLDIESAEPEWSSYEKPTERFPAPSLSTSVIIYILVFFITFLLPVGGGYLFHTYYHTNTLKARYGTLSKVLPDGSQIVLTEGSKLSYNTHFGEEMREIGLMGELWLKASAYQQPLLLRSGNVVAELNNATIEVIAWKHSSFTEIKVLKGVISVYFDEGRNNMVMAGPGETIKYSRKNSDYIISRDL